ncbi:hypothetical protein MNSC_08250 [Minisyncoccus archaeophilus]|uniref:CDP-alcohol phosphatidyltransferase family protein n=1 Tax=Minisyncoccus archaeiphilus TaxID=3238481 RepID=UPI00399C8491
MKKTLTEIMFQAKYANILQYYNVKIASWVVFKLQNYSLTANHFTLFSFFLSLLAIFFLLFLSSPILFILFLLLSFIFDNVDGIWARVKNQGSVFGAFLDPYIDKTKEYLVDFSFILFYYNELIAIIDFKSLFYIVIFYFIIKGLFYIIRDTDLFNDIYKVVRQAQYHKKGFSLTSGPLEKIIFVYPFILYSVLFLIIYFIGYLFLYILNIILILMKFSKNN